MRSAFVLDPAVVPLNHGSYGACPRAALDAQAAWRARIEAATTRFYVLEHAPALAAARARLAAFLGGDPAGLALVPNATTGVATALEALLEPGGEVLVTDHGYAACRHAVERVAARRGATVVTARLPFPFADPGQATQAILDAVTPATSLALLDHVSSPTAVVFDVAALAAALAARGVTVVVDGAHAPGQVELELAALPGVAVYVANLHKWTCAPKGAGVLWVRDDLRARVRPLVTSHAAALPADDPARFLAEHDWTGTADPTAHLAAPAALDEIARLGGGWPAVRAHNRAVTLAARDALCDGLGARPGAPDAATGAMAAIPVRLPAAAVELQRALLRDGWEVALIDWPAHRATYLRVSSHLYNTLDDAQRLAAHLAALGVRGA